MTFRRGARIGVDVGKARVGVARSDPDGLLAVPVETVPRTDTAAHRITEIADEYDALEILVGLPISLSGNETESTRDARVFATELASLSARPVRLVDERLSTVSAHSALRQSGRNQKSSRSMVDQVAAVVLLQQAIDVEKSTGAPTGALLQPDQEPR